MLPNPCFIHARRDTFYSIFHSHQPPLPQRQKTRTASILMFSFIVRCCWEVSASSRPALDSSGLPGCLATPRNGQYRPSALPALTTRVCGKEKVPQPPGGERVHSRCTSGDLQLYPKSEWGTFSSTKCIKINLTSCQ